MADFTSPQSLDALLEDLRRIKTEYVDAQLRWYTFRIPVVKIVFRVSGVLLIFASLSIPYLSILQGGLKTIGLPIAAFSVAFLSGVNSFFGWQPAWQKYVAVKLNVEHLVALWEVDMLYAKQLANRDDGARIAADATKGLLNGVALLTTTEAFNLFQSMKFPQASVPVGNERGDRALPHS